ncbi:agglutinin-like [Solanum pennellii]|uniref:Agglutinin-like n=1 Tax=Solanum pennellii TaxID=28526 RepID=A0ABM1GK70_SOLPN|nr:agglutinin-like [Solanum pennellii]
MGNLVSYDEVDQIMVEAWGGIGGLEWNYKFKSPIKEILINHGDVIDSIMFITMNEQGDRIESPRFGGNGGRRDKVVIKETSLEFLVGIKGRYGNYKGNLVVKSLSFVTNAKNIYGPFGKEDGTPFSFVIKEGGAIVGLHGLADSYLDAIGIYVNKLTVPKKREKKLEPNEPIVEEIEIHDKMDVMKTIVPRSAGPWGGCSGKGWDDGVFCTIKQVQVHEALHSSVISAIQIEYENKLDKSSFWSQLHGHEHGAKKTTKINVDGTDEFFIGIEGYYSPLNDNGGQDTIRQITFYTNKGKYGPYGIEIGTYFSSSAARGKIVGFHGKSGLFLNAIGVHMEYF